MRAKRYSAVASAWLLLEKPLRVIFPAESWGAVVSADFIIPFLEFGYLLEKDLAGLNWVNVGERGEMYLGRETEKRREKHKIIIPSLSKCPIGSWELGEETELWKRKKEETRVGRDNRRDGKSQRDRESERKSLCMRIAYETNRCLWKRSQYEMQWRWTWVCMWRECVCMCVCVYGPHALTQASQPWLEEIVGKEGQGKNARKSMYRWSEDLRNSVCSYECVREHEAEERGRGFWWYWLSTRIQSFLNLIYFWMCQLHESVNPFLFGLGPVVAEASLNWGFYHFQIKSVLACVSCSVTEPRFCISCHCRF